MTILFISLFVAYVLPLWFMFRLWYFTKDRETFSGGFDGADKTFSVFMILVVSWLGFAITCGVTDPHHDDIRRTFFLSTDKEKSMAAKIFWYKVRVLLLRLLFIKESA